MIVTSRTSTRSIWIGSGSGGAAGKGISGLEDDDENDVLWVTVEGVLYAIA